jgi:hypothetical protein
VPDASFVLNLLTRTGYNAAFETTWLTKSAQALNETPYLINVIFAKPEVTLNCCNT